MKLSYPVLAWVMAKHGPLMARNMPPVGRRATITLMKLGPVGALIDTLVFRPQFRKQMEQSLAALKEYVEHNEVVDTSVDLALTA
jgi:hypothetical protein